MLSPIQPIGGDVVGLLLPDGDERQRPEPAARRQRQGRPRRANRARHHRSTCASARRSSTTSAPSARRRTSTTRRTSASPATSSRERRGARGVRGGHARPHRVPDGRHERARAARVSSAGRLPVRHRRASSSRPAYRYAYFHPWQSGGGGGFDAFKLQYHTFGVSSRTRSCRSTAWLNYTLTGEEEGRKLTNDRIELLGQVTFCHAPRSSSRSCRCSSSRSSGPAAAPRRPAERRLRSSRTARSSSAAIARSATSATIIIENDRIRLVVQKPGFSRGFGVYGGSLIDADLRRPSEIGTSRRGARQRSVRRALPRVLRAGRGREHACSSPPTARTAARRASRPSARRETFSSSRRS